MSVKKIILTILLLVLICLAGLLFLAWAARGANDFGRRLMCANALRETYQAIEFYRTDSDGAYPASLELLQQYCEADPNRPVVRMQCCGERSRGDEIGRPWDYIYRPVDSDEENRPICWDCMAHRPDKRNVLYSNGEVKLLGAHEFIEEMRRFPVEYPFSNPPLEQEKSQN